MNICFTSMESASVVVVGGSSATAVSDSIGREVDAAMSTPSPTAAASGYTKQLTLTEDAPLILDATCSFAKVWPKTATVRIDIRAEVHPDLVMDNTALRFPDYFFDAIYYDPPHLFRSSSVKKTSNMRELFSRFGLWKSKAEFISNLKGVNREFYRCLKPSGRLYCKIGTGDKSMCLSIGVVIAALSNFETLEHRVTVSKSHLAASNPCHWLTMKPRPATAAKETS